MHRRKFIRHSLLGVRLTVAPESIAREVVRNATSSGFGAITRCCCSDLLDCGGADTRGADTRGADNRGADDDDDDAAGATDARGAAAAADSPGLINLFNFAGADDAAAICDAIPIIAVAQYDRAPGVIARADWTLWA